MKKVEVKKLAISLRNIVEAEGKGCELNVDTPASAWEMLAVSVRTIYRPARAKITSFDPALKKEGIREMDFFVKTQKNIAKKAKADAKDFRNSGDMANAFLHERVVDLARHNAASAMGWSSKKDQNKINNDIFENLQKTPKKERDENWRFVHSKVFFGLLENDEGFSKNIDMRSWENAVDNLFQDKYPDFPGRALRLAKEYAKQNKKSLAKKILQKAIAAKFGKEDQRAEARAYLKSFWE